MVKQMCNYLTYFFVRDFVVDYATCRRLHASPLFALPPDAKYRVIERQFITRLVNQRVSKINVCLHCCLPA